MTTTGGGAQKAAPSPRTKKKRRLEEKTRREQEARRRHQAMPGETQRQQRGGRGQKARPCASRPRCRCWPLAPTCGECSLRTHPARCALPLPVPPAPPCCPRSAHLHSAPRPPPARALADLAPPPPVLLCDNLLLLPRRLPAAARCRPPPPWRPSSSAHLHQRIRPSSLAGLSPPPGAATVAPSAKQTRWSMRAVGLSEPQSSLVMPSAKWKTWEHAVCPQALGPRVPVNSSSICSQQILHSRGSTPPCSSPPTRTT